MFNHLHEQLLNNEEINGNGLFRSAFPGRAQQLCVGGIIKDE